MNTLLISFPEYIHPLNLGGSTIQFTTYGYNKIKFPVLMKPCHYPVQQLPPSVVHRRFQSNPTRREVKMKKVASQWSLSLATEDGSDV